MNWLVITPDIEYKLRLIHDLLSSIQCDWSDDSALPERHSLAAKLCHCVIRDLTKQRDLLELRKNQKLSVKILNIPECLNLYNKYLEALYKLSDTIDGFTPDGTQDGKYFRYDFPDGYFKMLEFFDLED